MECKKQSLAKNYTLMYYPHQVNKIELSKIGDLKLFNNDGSSYNIKFLSNLKDV